MASPDLFALSHSALNPFLYADISLQDGATTLTIASLFGRCGYDPYRRSSTGRSSSRGARPVRPRATGRMLDLYEETLR